MAEDKKIKLNVGLPASAADGNSISINDENGDTSLIFFQLSPNRKPEDTEVEAIAVAHVRLSMEQLKLLRESLGTAIDGYEAKKESKAVSEEKPATE